MLIAGPTPEQLQSFIKELQEEKEQGKYKIMEMLSDISGNSLDSVKKWFSPKGSTMYRACPYAVWKLWNMELKKTLKN